MLDETMLFERGRFRRELDALAHLLPRISDASNSDTPGKIDTAASDSYRKRLNRLAYRMERSRGLALLRREKVPALSFDPELPIVERRDEIAKLIRDNPVVIVCGETGSGKSTQLPKICLELGRGVFGMIAQTQPRRIAARSIARRIADEIATESDERVGFKIRFTDSTASATLIKVMTDGILLAESQTDPLFERYDTIIIDEAHERSLNIDFLLGLMKRVLAKRSNLKLIITSATIDAVRFAEHFSHQGRPAPIIEVSGRTYPIEIRYRPPEELDLGDEFDEYGRRTRLEKNDEQDLRERALLEAVNECAAGERGDMLIFMPTQRDILDAAKLLKKHAIPGDDAVRQTEILPLYARLSFDEQRKIFATFSPGSSGAPGSTAPDSRSQSGNSAENSQPRRQKRGWRKIVIATNVAESSLTVPGIRYVIDTGTARMSRYSARSRTQRLPIEPISRASADQRAGRCGRVASGVCIRLYSEDDYRARDEFTTPEIRRTNLAAVILRTLALKLGAVERFPFLDPPGRGTIADGYKTLFELGAIDAENRITPMGRKLARLPVDPRIGRMILAAAEENCLAEMLPLAGALEILDPRERPVERAAKADAAHEKFLDENSDFLSYLKIWDFWEHLKETLSLSKLRKAAAENFLSFNRMREWLDIHRQLLRLVSEAKLPLGKRRDAAQIAQTPNLYDALHRAVLTGLLIGIAQKGEKGEYAAALGGKFVLWPGSGLASKRPGWIVAAERVETSRRFLRCCAKISPGWIEPLAAGLLDQSYHEPHWCRETGYVHAYEKVSLLGLVIVPKRRINYGPLQPLQAREIFIQRALVEEEFDSALDFFVHNKATLEQARSLQAKLRAHDLLRGESARYTFYQERIPDDVYDTKTLKKWLKSLSNDEKKRLEFSLADLCVRPIDSKALERFPDELPAARTEIPLEYRFEPGEETDGLTAIVTSETLASADVRRAAGWLVPGLLEAKIAALLKSLPKEIRRSLVPIPDTAREIAEKLLFGEGDFYAALAKETSRLAGRLVTPGDFALDRLPRELLLNLRVVDEGETIAESRNADELIEQLGVQTRQTLEQLDDPLWTRDGIETWDFGPFPESVTLSRQGRTLTAYPAICDGESVAGKPETVSLRLFDSLAKANEATRLGLTRLFYLAAKRDLRTQADWLPDADRLRAIAATLPEFPFKTVIGELIAARALQSETVPIPRCEEDYQRLVAAGKSRIGSAATEITYWSKAFLNAYQSARLMIEKQRAPLFTEARGDCRRLFERLLFPGFYRTVPWERLREYPRYFQAVAVRYDGLAAGKSAADHSASIELAGYWDRFETLKTRLDESGLFDPELETFRWMLEEYTVSLFAQKLGTAQKVSPVRIEKQWEKIGLK